MLVFSRWKKSHWQKVRMHLFPFLLPVSGLSDPRNKASGKWGSVPLPHECWLMRQLPNTLLLSRQQLPENKKKKADVESEHGELLSRESVFHFLSHFTCHIPRNIIGSSFQTHPEPDHFSPPPLPALRAQSTSSLNRITA